MRLRGGVEVLEGVPVCKALSWALREAICLACFVLRERLLGAGAGAGAGRGADMIWGVKGGGEVPA